MLQRTTRTRTHRGTLHPRTHTTLHIHTYAHTQFHPNEHKPCITHPAASWPLPSPTAGPSQVHTKTTAHVHTRHSLHTDDYTSYAHTPSWLIATVEPNSGPLSGIIFHLGLGMCLKKKVTAKMGSSSHRRRNSDEQIASASSSCAFARVSMRYVWGRVVCVSMSMSACLSPSLSLCAVFGEGMCPPPSSSSSPSPTPTHAHATLDKRTSTSKRRARSLRTQSKSHQHAMHPNAVHAGTRKTKHAPT